MEVKVDEGMQGGNGAHWERIQWWAVHPRKIRGFKLIQGCSRLKFFPPAPVLSQWTPISAGVAPVAKPACRGHAKPLPSGPHVAVIQYDPVNQLLAMTVHGNTAAGAILRQYAYAYDAAGNRTAEQIGGGASGLPLAISQSSYNGNNQMTNRVGGAGSVLFAGSLSKPAAVTVAGNAATVNHQTTNFTGYATVASGTNGITLTATDYSGNAATNRYQLVVTNNGVAKWITYDLNGNETSVVTATSTNTCQWDAVNRLVSITGPTNQSVFTYDGMGRRVQIVEYTNGVAASTNKYVWSGLSLSEQRDAGGNVLRRFFGQGEQIAGTNYFYTRDHLGSVRELTDVSGAIHARYDYDPYGRQSKISGDMDADFGYAGYYAHRASGLWLTLFRAYDADLGRWLNQDPIGERGGINLYEAFFNSPTFYVDRNGLDNIGGQTVNGTYNNAPPSFPISLPKTPEIPTWTPPASWTGPFLSQRDPEPGDKGDNGDGLETAANGVGYAGLGLTGLEFGSGPATVGSNFKPYWKGWGGNGYVSTCKIGEFAHDLGPLGFVAATGVDGLRWYNGDTNMDGGKFWLNTGIGAVGLGGGPIGAGAAGLYFIFDGQEESVSRFPVYSIPAL